MKNPSQVYLITAIFLEFGPYYKVIYLVKKLSSAYFRISKIWIQTWVQIFNMKILIFDISQEHSIFNLTIDLRVLGHGEQLCLLDFLADMQLFCSLQMARKYNKIYWNFNRFHHIFGPSWVNRKVASPLGSLTSKVAPMSQNS